MVNHFSLSFLLLGLGEYGLKQIAVKMAQSVILVIVVLLIAIRLMLHLNIQH